MSAPRDDGYLERTLRNARMPVAREQRQQLTLREREALRLIATGCTYREAAALMHVGERRMANILRSAYAVLGVASGTGSGKSAIDAFRSLGWLRVPPA